MRKREREKERERKREKERGLYIACMADALDTKEVASKRRNPSWSREELILALDLYFRVPPSGVTENHPEIVRLSQELQQLSRHADPGDAARFRNPNGVHMKMFNFKALDPAEEGRGLANGGRRDKEVWNEYQGDRAKLTQVATAIRSAIDSERTLQEIFREDEPEDVEAAEGRVLTRMHRYRERDSSIIRRKKDQVLSASGTLKCEVCDFDFKAVYGPAGEGFIECHHTKPVASLLPGDRTKLSELALVCANCHRMLHRPKHWLSIQELRNLLSGCSQRSTS